jgi:inner membrane protein
MLSIRSHRQATISLSPLKTPEGARRRVWHGMRSAAQQAAGVRLRRQRLRKLKPDFSDAFPAASDSGKRARRCGRSPGRPRMRSAVLRPVLWWAGPLVLAAAALALDATDRRIPFGVWTTGPVDELAHLSTAALGLLILARFIDAPRRFYVAALIASVAIDVDHIPLYLGLLGNQAQRPVTHSLSTVAVFVAAAVASRRHRAVLAGVATGLVLHFARDIAEGYPGVRVFWPLQDTSWMVSYRWFLGMIVVFAAARLVLVSVGRPHTRIPVFRTPPPSGSIPRSSNGPATSGDRSPGLEPQGPDPNLNVKGRRAKPPHQVCRLPHRAWPDGKGSDQPAWAATTSWSCALVEPG